MRGAEEANKMQDEREERQRQEKYTQQEERKGKRRGKGRLLYICDSQSQPPYYIAKITARF